MRGKPLPGRTAAAILLIAEIDRERAADDRLDAAPAIFSENSSAPNMLSVSVSASAGWRSFLASSASRAMVSAPSSSE